MNDCAKAKSDLNFIKQSLSKHGEIDSQIGFIEKRIKRCLQQRTQVKKPHSSSFNNNSNALLTPRLITRSLGFPKLNFLEKTPVGVARAI